MKNWQLQESTNDAYQQITAYLACKIKEAAKAAGITSNIVVERGKSGMARQDVRVMVTSKAKDEGLVKVLNNIANEGLEGKLGQKVISPIPGTYFFINTYFSKAKKNYYGISINGDPRNILDLIRKKDPLILANASREASANSLG